MSDVNEQAAITDALERCGATGVDIVPEVFARFFARDAQARALMAHSDRHMQGRMLEATLDLFLSSEHLGPGNYLDWELDNHLNAYRATPSMYQSFFDSVTEVVRELADSGWSGEHERAWTARIDRIMDQVREHPTSRVG